MSMGIRIVSEELLVAVDPEGGIAVNAVDVVRGSKTNENLN